MKNLDTLMAALHPDAGVAGRHIWLIQVFDWIRGSEGDTAASLARVQQLITAFEATPDKQAQLQAWWQKLVATVDVSTLLADFGFAPRAAFISELAARLRRKILPGTPETRDASELFALAASSRSDALWLAALDEDQIQRLIALLSAPDRQRQARHWQSNLLDAITYCSTQICATGFAPELRLRMGAADVHARAFHALPAEIDKLRAIVLPPTFPATPAPATDEAALLAAVIQFRERLDACRRAINSVYAHLDHNGVSVDMVFLLRQLRERILRVRELLDCLLSAKPATATLKLLARLVVIGQESQSIRALINANSSLLAAKMAERSAETGEHYITRTRAEYREILGKAMGGGAITAFTTLLKFMLLTLSLSAFWGGLLAGVLYAASFILIQLLHWTLATKQPAMTAPAMAAKLKDLDSNQAVEDFVTEVTHLVRSQVAAVLGNVLMVIPVVLLLNALYTLSTGRAMIDAASARLVFAALDPRGTALLWAAFTGTVLFASSIIAGWAENWFVLHRLDSALRYNPRLTRVLGTARAARWAQFMRDNISGLASNIALGLMLGLIPAFSGFFGLELEVRHVTLSTGQLAAAAASLGLAALSQPALWWAAAAIPLIGALNLSVSFYLAFRLALRAHNVGNISRARLNTAIWQRWRTQPASFLVPEKPPSPE